VRRTDEVLALLESAEVSPPALSGTGGI